MNLHEIYEQLLNENSLEAFLYEQYLYNKSTYFHSHKNNFNRDWDIPYPDIRKSETRDGAFFFTKNYGYALLYSLRNELVPSFFERNKKFNYKIKIFEDEIIDKNKLLKNKDCKGWLFPLILEDTTNILDFSNLSDIRNMTGIISRIDIPGLRNMNLIEKMEKLSNELYHKDWWKMNDILGIERNEFIDFLRKNTYYDGFNNFEYDNFGSIGIFQDKIDKCKFASLRIITIEEENENLYLVITNNFKNKNRYIP